MGSLNVPLTLDQWHNRSVITAGGRAGGEYQCRNDSSRSLWRAALRLLRGSLAWGGMSDGEGSGSVGSWGPLGRDPPGRSRRPAGLWEAPTPGEADAAKCDTGWGGVPGVRRWSMAGLWMEGAAAWSDRAEAQRKWRPSLRRPPASERGERRACGGGEAAACGGRTGRGIWGRRHRGLPSPAGLQTEPPRPEHPWRSAPALPARSSNLQRDSLRRSWSAHCGPRWGEFLLVFPGAAARWGRGWKAVVFEAADERDVSISFPLNWV